MTLFLATYAAMAVMFGAWACLAIKPASTIRRVLLAIGLGPLLAATFFLAADMLGRPKSIRFEAFSAMPNATIIAAQIAEDRAIDLWLRLDGSPEPRYYELPWDKKIAEALQRAIEENAREHGPGVGMSLPFEWSLDKDRSPQFYQLPRPKLPDKPDEPAPKIYTAPGSDA